MLAFLKFRILGLLCVFAVIRADKVKKDFQEDVFRFKQPISEDPSSSFQSSTCGYDRCDLGKPGMLNVHLVPHTHDDVGWLKTVNQYYLSDVQYILDNSVNTVQLEAKRRFIYVEMAFFNIWWNELTESGKNRVREIVNSGQLEFILGGWSMNDEAATHYSSIIDHHTLGFDFLKQNFGECGVPKIGWQIDPFGHSREQASIFAQFGFDGLFFARIDYQDFEKRKNDKRLEHMWFGSDSLDDRSSLFTGTLYHHYSTPSGFCYECGAREIQDHPEMDNYYVDDAVENFISTAKDQAAYFTTNHIMWTMGDDFKYKNADIQFRNMEKLIKNVNKLQENGSKINALFSTPSCYVYALNQANVTYTSKSDDFFPYADSVNRFWTGYYTSRPALKLYERTSNNMLQICKQLDVLGLVANKKSGYSKVDDLKKAMGILQHHDAVSGTSKQHVANDYAKILAEGVEQCQDVVKMSLTNLLVASPALKRNTFDEMQFCNLLNVSNCNFTETSEKFAIVVYNPVGQQVSTYVRLPVMTNNFKVLNSSLKQIKTQVISVTDRTKSLPERYDSKSNFELVFPVQLPPLGYSTYFVSNSKNLINGVSSQSHVRKASSELIIENEHLKLTFSSDSGLLTTIENLKSGIKLNATQSLLRYRTFSSGAYVFVSSGDPLKINLDKVQLTIVKGHHVTEVHQKFSDWATQIVRLYNGAKHFEIEWTIGSLMWIDNGAEIISSFETSLDSKDVFYTDANARQMMRRVRNYRPTWKLEQTDPISGNYYPINSRIFIRDPVKNMQLTVLTDRSQGGSSIRSGQMELMLHRRTYLDDGYGVDEALQDPGINGEGLIVRGVHKVIFDTIEASTQLHRFLAQQTYMAPYYGFIKLSQSPQEFVEQYNVKWSGLKMELPKNVHLLTLEEWHSGSVLLRLEHFYEKNEDPVLSKSATVSLKNMFNTLKIKSVEEFTLGANKKLKEAKRLQWNVEGYGKTPKDMDASFTPIKTETLEVELKPMQIRTFIVELEH